MYNPICEAVTFTGKRLVKGTLKKRTSRDLLIAKEVRFPIG
jgi:hypothetical protein